MTAASIIEEYSPRLDAIRLVSAYIESDFETVVDITTKYLDSNIDGMPDDLVAALVRLVIETGESK